VANWVAVKADVASSRMRRFFMMSLVPGIRPNSNGTACIDMSVWSIERLIIRPDCGDLQMVGCFLFHWRNGLHVSLFIARSGEIFIRHPDRWRDWACGGRSARVSVARPASCPATPAVAAVDPALAMGVARPGEDYPEDFPTAARLVVPVSPAVSPAVRSASRLPKFQFWERQRQDPREVPARRANGTGRNRLRRHVADGFDVVAVGVEHEGAV